MNATKRSDPVDTLTIVICMAVPVTMLLCICCIILLKVERRNPLTRATVVIPIVLEAQLIDIKVVPPLP